MSLNLAGVAMLDCVILSVKPRWADKILSGQKVIELRRRFPIPPSPISALLYASSPTKALVGVVTVESVACLPPDVLWPRVAQHACVTIWQYQSYFEESDKAFALRV